MLGLEQSEGPFLQHGHAHVPAPQRVPSALQRDSSVRPSVPEGIPSERPSRDPHSASVRPSVCAFSLSLCPQCVPQRVPSVCPSVLSVSLSVPPQCVSPQFLSARPLSAPTMTWRGWGGLEAGRRPRPPHAQLWSLSPLLTRAHTHTHAAAMLEELNELLDATPQRPDTVRAGGGKAGRGRWAVGNGAGRREGGGAGHAGSCSPGGRRPWRPEGGTALHRARWDLWGGQSKRRGCESVAPPGGLSYLCRAVTRSGHTLRKHLHLLHRAGCIS